ncbi:MAG: hypothetical protein K2N10_04405 [Muribaculaceae bacterium]|nr:hypothetical protein [Muribaculaceae bacterium]
MKYISYISAALLALVSFSACDTKDDYSYTPSDPTVAGRRVYFAQSSESFEVKDGVNSVEISVYRPESEKAAEQRVELETTDSSGLFSVPASVVIPAGQISAPVEITFDGDALADDKPYKLDIAISELYANDYAISSTAVTITRSNWSAWEPFNKDGGIGVYSFSLLYQGDEYPVQLLCRTSSADQNSKQYQLQWLNDYDDPDSWSTFLTFTSANGGKTLEIPEQPFLEDEDYGTIYVSSIFAFTGNDAYQGLSTYNEETGLFTFNLVYYNAEYLFGNGNETFLLVGSATPQAEPAAHALRVPRVK